VSTPPLVRVVEREARVFQRLWRGSVFSSLLTPILFLAAMGVGLGNLVDQRSGGAGGVSYLDFIAPGLLAASAAMVASGDALWPVLGSVKWQRTAQGMTATPISADDVFAGRILWEAIRTAMSATAFLVVAALFGAVPSWWGVLAVPAATLGAVAFGAPISAFSVTQETDLAFPVIFRLVVVPLFLFSGTFFPIDRLPGWAQPIAVVSPLWHAVELCRAATTGHATSAAAIVVHVAVLGAFVAAGWFAGSRTFTRRLAS
jgi:lipooligosaccharide transport system permease protein